MFKVFISADSLKTIYQKEGSNSLQNSNDWVKVIVKQNYIYLDRDVSGELLNPGNPLFLLSKSHGIQFRVSSINYNIKLNRNGSKILEEPQGVFLLDIEPSEAAEIQNKYGVLCRSTKNLKDCPLALAINSISTIKGDNTYSWGQLFQARNTFPSNYLIIVDRYIFSYESKVKSNFYDGISNIIPKFRKNECH